jgi:hypothetical protein
MGEKTALHTTLAYPEENYAHKEFCLNKLPVIHDDIKQLSSEWHNTLKYFQDESHFHNIWKIKGSVSRMTKTMTSRRGKQNAC